MVAQATVPSPVRACPHCGGHLSTYRRRNGKPFTVCRACARRRGSDTERISEAEVRRALDTARRLIYGQ